jgi:hypothetical protein
LYWKYFVCFRARGGFLSPSMLVMVIIPLLLRVWIPRCNMEEDETKFDSDVCVCVRVAAWSISAVNGDFSKLDAGSEIKVWCGP